MTTAITLLISAMQLLTLVQSSPTLPQSFRDNAISIANQAIVYAQTEIAKTQQVTQQAEQAFPVPTCTLVGSTYIDPVGNVVGRVEWVTTNANEGQLLYPSMDLTKPFYDNGILNDNSISKGYARSLTLSGGISGTTFTISIRGRGGETKCSTTIKTVD